MSYDPVVTAARIKKLRTCAAAATLSTLPAYAREALTASVELLAELEARTRELEKKINGV